MWRNPKPRGAGAQETTHLDLEGKRVRATQDFSYEGETVSEGSEAELLGGRVEEAIERGYAEEVSEDEGSSFPSSPSQQDKVQKLREIIGGIAGDYGGDVPVSAVVEEAKGEGIGSDFVEKFVEWGLRNGDLTPSEKDGEKAVTPDE